MKDEKDQGRAEWRRRAAPSVAWHGPMEASVWLKPNFSSLFAILFNFCFSPVANVDRRQQNTSSLQLDIYGIHIRQSQVQPWMFQIPGL
jgi:hypothetical protein